MPNNITNKLQFIGDEKEIEECKKFIKSDSHIIDFDKIIKMPEELNKNEGWYYWRTEHWGTKWNAYEETVDANDTSIIVFSTAWRPSVKVIEELSKRFLNLTFKLSFLDDPAMGTRAAFVLIKEGIILEEKDIKQDEF
jgi:hypothetical protein